VMDIAENDAIDMARKMAKQEGVFAGMSSGGALSAAIKLAGELKEGVIVFICCDRGDRYLSSELFG
jgi:cysteine synthase B